MAADNDGGDGWEADILAQRHVHNRNKKNARSSGGTGGDGGTGFDVRKTFGSFELSCPAAEKLSSSPSILLETANGRNAKKQNRGKAGKGSASDSSRLELYRQTEARGGLVGELFLSGVLEATVILAGSQKRLQEIVRGLDEAAAKDLESSDEDDDAELDLQSPQSIALSPGGDISPIRNERMMSDDSDDDRAGTESDDDLSGSSSDADKQERIDPAHGFEKNSFRQPKFWLYWRGRIQASSAVVGLDDSLLPETQSGMGYLVFTGNQCRDFKGTISSDHLGWQDVAIKGWKRTGASERDIPVPWLLEGG